MLTALAIVFDGIDIQLMGVAIPSIMREWNVPRSAFAPAVSFGYLGMVVGGATAGLVGDRFGRRTALLACMLLFGAMTGAASLSQSVAVFALLRFAAGIGLGGAIPNAAALAAEFVPLRMRPLAVTAHRRLHAGRGDAGRTRLDPRASGLRLAGPVSGRRDTSNPRAP